MIAQTLHYLEKRPALLYGAIALLTLATLFLTLLPQDRLGEVALFQYDKLGHILMFGGWTFLLGLILLISDRRPLPLLAIFFAGCLFGISIEILQEVLPGKRHMDLGDVVADIIGCLIATGLLKWITLQLPR